MPPPPPLRSQLQAPAWEHLHPSQARGLHKTRAPRPAIRPPTPRPALQNPSGGLAGGQRPLLSVLSKDLASEAVKTLVPLSSRRSGGQMGGEAGASRVKMGGDPRPPGAGRVLRGRLSWQQRDLGGTAGRGRQRGPGPGSPGGPASLPSARIHLLGGTRRRPGADRADPSSAHTLGTVQTPGVCLDLRTPSPMGGSLRDAPSPGKSEAQQDTMWTDGETQNPPDTVPPAANCTTVRGSPPRSPRAAHLSSHPSCALGKPRCTSDGPGGPAKGLGRREERKRSHLGQAGGWCGRPPPGCYMHDRCRHLCPLC